MTSSGDVRALAYGGACLWRFGGDAACAKQARDALGAAMREMGFDADAIDSGRLAVSELATNGHQHASRLAVSADAAAVELWIWARTHPARELVVSVFDACREAVPCGSSGGLLDESGKGLGIVEAVAASWGWRYSRSRLASRPVPGKATWFALPLPDGWPSPCRGIAPSTAAARLQELLGSRGLATLCRGDAAGISVVTSGSVDVWVTPGWFSWKNGTGYDRYPLLDLQEAAERVVGRLEDASRRSC